MWREKLFAKPHDKTNTKIGNHKIIGKLIHYEINYHSNIKILKYATHAN